ncbi:MAG: HNH endonuclease [Proteobacteria bacterium]|nr:HNH endonuclease [Pseudomonadota bacterium]MBU1419184.1 HNH endonuclease [Pseudomonadota bacterium]MBU1456435.1 HNH endonuclease [Pseudomonadota bacterium]
MSREFFDFDAPDESEIRRERAKARDLRKSRWWQQRTAPGKCHFCGRKVPFKELTMDHLLPLGRGGRSTKDNLVPCCKSCNNKKKSMLPLEWEEYIENLKSETE